MLTLIPSLLFVTYCFVNSVSRLVLNAIGDCIAFFENATTQRSFLRPDLTVTCGSSEHGTIKTVAWVLFGGWTVGVPLLYTLLLLHCGASIQRGKPTELAAAISFLWSELKPEYYWWEPVDMLRKLALSSFVLFVPAEYPLTR